tara:strand:+ start:14437 stop:17724 length:3288 start_codon:yes stop_codon:yes gene_type:complete
MIFGLISDAIDFIGDLGQDIIDFTVDAISDIIGWFIDIPNMDDLENQYKGVLVNKQSNISARPVVYGQRKVGGTRVFMATSGDDNTYLYIVLDLCEGEIHSIGDIYINDVISTDSKFSGLVTINKYLGTDGQQVDPILLAANIGWTSAHKLSGVAYLAVRLKWDQETFSGIPTIHAVVQGRKVYDTRTNATATVALSSNPALCLRDYLTNTRYGKGLAASFIDDTSFDAAANKCDALVTSHSGGSGTQKIFECNAVVNTENTLLDNAKSLLSSMRGLMLYRQGLYGLIVEDEGNSTFSFNESHIISGLSIKSESKRTKFNRIIATFPNPDANWQMDQIEYPVAGSSEESGYLTEDGGVELVKQMDLPSTTNIYTAKDMAEMALKRSRNALVTSFRSTSEALNVSIGDIVDVTHSTPSWTAKTFRVFKLGLRIDGTVDVTLIEHQDSIYPWSTKTEADNIPDTNLPNPFTVAAPTSLSVNVGASNYLVQTDGFVLVRAKASWTASIDQFVERYVVQWKYASDSVYENDVVVTGSNAYISGFKTGESIDVRVKAVSALGVSSAFLIVSATTVTAHATAPSVVTNLTATAKQGAIELSWTNPTNADFSYVQINRHTSDSLANSTLFLNTSNTSVVDAVGENLARFYWARAFNRSGVASAWTSTATATSTSFPAAAAPKITHNGLVYYSVNQANAPSTPSATGYNFSTGVISGLTSGWSLVPPTLDIGASNKYWSSAWSVLEATSGGGTGVPAFLTAQAQFTFDGVVTFTNGTTVTDGTNTVTTNGLLASGGAAADINANSTTINGGKITTGTVTADVVRANTELSAGTGNTPNSKAFEVNAAGVVWTDGIIGGIFAGNNLYVSTAPAVTGTTRQAHPALLGQVSSINASTSAHAVRGTNSYTTGSRVQTSGLIGAANGYDFYAEGAGTNYGPFTGAHDCLVANDKTVSIGDLVVDVSCIARRGLSNTLFSVEASNSANQSAVLGVIVANNGSLSDRQPAAFIEEMTEDGIVMTDDYETVKNSYQIMAVNAVGEGQIKVIGEGGDLAAGDLIVTSSSAGRGMKQSDNSIRSHTVARVRESVSFSSVSEVKLAACIYLCG